MSWTEELTKERKEYWSEKISDIKGIIEDTVKSHQETKEYAQSEYGFRVFARRVESEVIRIQVCFEIGDEGIEIASFQNEDAAITCTIMLATELEKEGFEIATIGKKEVDFSDMNDHILCEGAILLS